MFAESRIVTACPSRLVLFAICLLLQSCAYQSTSPVTVFSGHTMGTSYSVKVAGILTPELAEQVDLGIKRRLDTIDGLMSTWRKDSEISQINRHPIGIWKKLSNHTFEVIRLAQKISEQTSGSFDVTVGPLVNIWGFGPGVRESSVPSEGEVKKIMQRVGYWKIQINKETCSVRRDADLSLDLSAIAKGYAIDRVSEYLEIQNLNNFLVEVGGELRTKGHKHGGGDWVVAIESPEVGVRNAFKKLVLKNKAIATSGDYRNFYVKDGQNYSHTIDPETGRPVSHQLVSVSVIDDSTARADALATALLVMGPEKGIQFSERLSIPAFFIVNEKGFYSTHSSSTFKKYGGSQVASIF